MENAHSNDEIELWKFSIIKNLRTKDKNVKKNAMSCLLITVKLVPIGEVINLKKALIAIIFIIWPVVTHVSLNIK